MVDFSNVLVVERVEWNCYLSEKYLEPCCPATRKIELELNFGGKFQMQAIALHLTKRNLFPVIRRVDGYDDLI